MPLLVPASVPGASGPGTPVPAAVAAKAEIAQFVDHELYVILDNLNTHKKNERWLKKHPKGFHFIPTRSSWLNQVEISFRSSRANH
jgi:hypothetical protein